MNLYLSGWCIQMNAFIYICMYACVLILYSCVTLHTFNNIITQSYRHPISCPQLPMTILSCNQGLTNYQLFYLSESQLRHWATLYYIYLCFTFHKLVRVFVYVTLVLQHPLYYQASDKTNYITTQWEKYHLFVVHLHKWRYNNISRNKINCHTANRSHTVIVINGHIDRIFSHTSALTQSFNMLLACVFKQQIWNSNATYMPCMQISSCAHMTQQWQYICLWTLFN